MPTTVQTIIRKLPVGARFSLAGDAYTVAEGRTVRADRRGVPYPIDSDDYFGGWDLADLTILPLEAAEVEAAEFEAYHESMLPMFRKISKEADDAGYCGEYDRLAQAIGAPTREQIKQIVGQKKYRVSVPILTHLDIEVDAASDEQDAINQAYGQVSFYTAFKDKAGFGPDNWSTTASPRTEEWRVSITAVPIEAATLDDI